MGVIALFRLIVAAHLPVIDDEAYYWLWSRHLSLSYLDHPPLVAWLDAVTTWDGRTEWLLRLPAMVATLVTTAFLYLLGRDLFDRSTGIRAAALHLAVPVFAVQAVDAIPDPLLYAWWAAAMWSFWHAVHGERRMWWICGLACGGGLLSKYPMVVLLAGFAAVLAWPRYRVWWRTPGPCLALGICLVLAAPIVFWNTVHGWPSLHFWLKAGQASGPVAGKPLGKTLLDNTAVQFAYGGPLLFPALIWALWRSWRLGERDERFAFLTLAATPTLLVVAAASLVGAAQGNWPAPAYLPAAVGLAALWPRRFGSAALASSLVLSSIALVLVTLAPQLPSWLRWDELYGWREVTAEMMRRADALGAPGNVLLLGKHYNQASYFGYYTGGREPVTTGRMSMFSFWAPPGRFAGWQGIAAVDARDAAGELRDDCGHLVPLPEYRLAFPGGGARSFLLFHCLDYRGTPRPP
jgi:dolichol-phosphate mannosyltransferase